MDHKLKDMYEMDYTVLQETKKNLLQENRSLRSGLDSLRREHGDCMRSELDSMRTVTGFRLLSDTCYCWSGDVPMEYCPAKI